MTVKKKINEFLYIKKIKRSKFNGINKIYIKVWGHNRNKKIFGERNSIFFKKNTL